MFTVRLPEHEMPSRRASEPSTPVDTHHAASLRGRTVLIVDDNADALELIRRLLVENEAEVLTAASARDAMTQLERSLPDVLVSDIGMPDLDGYDLIRYLRTKVPGGDSVSAVAVTAFARPEDRERTLCHGFQAHVPKPIDPSRLLASGAGQNSEPSYRGPGT